MPDKKVISQSLRSILDNETMRVIRDKKVDIEPLTKSMVHDWSLDLFSRKPGPAANSLGEFVGSDLDLATFSAALLDRSAVINIPRYETMRARTAKEGERTVSKNNRHGNVIGMFSNKEVFSFGIRINDMNVVVQHPTTGKETVGAPRNFTLVDCTGKWHDGWHTIEFSPTAKENDFLNDRKIWTGHSVIVKFFVHPNRWQSFYGAPYFLAKAMIDRLTEECSYLRKVIKGLKTSGVKYPSTGTGGDEPVEYPSSEKVSESQEIKVTAFEVEIDIPENPGEFAPVPATPEGLKAASEKLTRLQFRLRDPLSFATRSVELAFARYGFNNEAGAENKMHDTSYLINIADSEEKMPGWIDARWERDYVLPGKRNRWNRMVLFQPAVGQQGVALRYRTWQKTEHVAAESKLALANA